MGSSSSSNGEWWRGAVICRIPLQGHPLPAAATVHGDGERRMPTPAPCGVFLAVPAQEQQGHP